jgi:hypothetical protein
LAVSPQHLTPGQVVLGLVERQREVLQVVGAESERGECGGGAPGRRFEAAS